MISTGLEAQWAAERASAAERMGADLAKHVGLTTTISTGSGHPQPALLVANPACCGAGTGQPGAGQPILPAPAGPGSAVARAARTGVLGAGRTARGAAERQSSAVTAPHGGSTPVTSNRPGTLTPEAAHGLGASSPIGA